MITYNIITIDWVINILRELLDGVLTYVIIAGELPGEIPGEIPESLGEEKGDKEFIEELIKKIKELIRNGGSKEEIIRLLKLLIQLLEKLLGIKIDIDLDKHSANILADIIEMQLYWIWATANVLIGMYGIYTIKRSLDIDHYPDYDTWLEEKKEKKKQSDKKKKRRTRRI